ncbi:MAG: hypothetical protein M3O32_01845 [Actinomycetota bacterium]|nr:hypothetical protein [Actinomycetota bacterium]
MSTEVVRSLVLTMQALGYDADSAGLYIWLLVQGPRTPARLESDVGLVGAALRVPVARLVSDGLVFEDRDGHQTIWYCFDPAISWLSLAAEETWSLVSSLNTLDDLPSTGRPEVDERCRLLLLARELATSSWRASGGATRHRHTRAPNMRILTRLVLEAVHQASTRVRAISAAPKISSASAFWPVMHPKLRAGLEYLRLADLTEVHEHGLTIVGRDLADGVQLRIRERERLAGSRGYLADRRILVKYDEVAAGLAPTTGVLLTQKHAIERFIKTFNGLWPDGLPAQDVIADLRARSGDLRDLAVGLGSDAQTWLDGLIEWGRFCTEPAQGAWSDEYQRELLDRLRASGAVVINEEGRPLPAWPDPQVHYEQLAGQ